MNHSFGSPAWEAALLAAVNPADFEALDLSGVRHLYSRLRGSPGGWSPAARIDRALRCGLLARAKLGFQRSPAVTACDSPLPNRIYIVLRGAPGHPAGWTDHYATFRNSVTGSLGRQHADAVCEGFASRAEGQAYCFGAERVWPPPLRRLD